MMKFLSILATLPLLALAVPHGYSENPNILHRDTHTVAFDEDNHRLIAFDIEGRELGIYSVDAELPMKRQAVNCFPMKDSDIRDIPGIETLRQRADDKWGTGSRREVVNDQDFLDRTMNVCADDAGAVVVYDSTPTCKTVTNEAEGTLEGGKVWLQNEQGVSMSSVSTVTRSSKWGVGIKVTTGFKFPGIADLTTEISGTAEFTNEQGSSTSVSDDQRTLQRIEQPVDEGQICKMMLNTDTCRISGKARLNMVATGFLWFQYHDRTKGHYKWGMVIDRELPNIRDRSTIIEFKTNGNVKSTGRFSTENCTKDITIISQAE